MQSQWTKLLNRSHRLAEVLAGRTSSRRRVRPGLERLEDRITPAAPCIPEACLVAGPRLVMVDTTTSVELNTVLGDITTGSSLNVNVLDWNAISQGNVNVNTLLTSLAARANVSSPSQALGANVTLNQLLLAAADAATVGGNTADATILKNLAATVAPLTGTIQLGSLLKLDFPNAPLVNGSVNLLDLVTGTFELYNLQNVATTPAPITVSGTALGVPGLANSVTIQAQVVEPPVYVCGTVGTQFFSAAIRLKMNMNLVTVTPNATSIANAIANALGTGVSVTANLSLDQLQIYADVARAQGTITAINAVTNAVTVQATPGVADVYLGTIPDATFFNRTHVLNPNADVGFATIGSLSITATSPLGTIASGTTSVQAKSFALGQAPFNQTLNFTPPYPETLVATTSAAFAANLANGLVQNLMVQTSGTLGPVLDPLVNTVILPPLKSVTGNALTPILTSALTNVADPLLHALGIQLGLEYVTLEGVSQECPPTANNDVYSTNQNTPLNVPAPGVLANDFDMDGEAITAIKLTNPAHGTVTLNPDGSFSYVPTTGFTGQDSFTYEDQDTAGLLSNVATVTINVNPLPQPPVANNDSYSATENMTLTVPAPGVQANDTSPSGRALTSTVVTNPAHGTVTLNPNGSFSYTPANGFTGTDTFTYQDNDGVSNSNVATVTITVNPAPQPPIARDDAYSATQNMTLTVPAPGVQANDTDPQGQPLTSQIASQPTHGTVTLNPDGSFSYTPNTGYTGPDSFTYTDRDTSGLTSNTATVRLTVNPANSQPPVANNDAYSTNENTPLNVPTPGVQANDTSPSGRPLTSTVVTGPSHGTVTLNPNGSFSYTPATNFSGQDTFTYQDNDGVNNSNVATVTITVNQTAQPPVARDDAYSATQNMTLTVPAPGVQANDTDPQGQPLTSQIASQPTHGTVTLNPDGSFSYTPNTGYTGPDSFTYTDRDTSGLTSNTATVRLTVNPANSQPPVANNDAYSTNENTPLNVPTPGVQANDTSPSGRPLTSTVVTGPSHGTVTLNPNGSFSYTPATNFSGQDTFTYQDNDGVNNSNVATVTITVNQTAQPPVARDDAYSVVENTPLTVPAPGVQANDTDPQGQPLTSEIASQPTHGTVTLNPNGSFTYTPNTGYTGPDSFTYTDRDTSGLTSNTATVRLTVNPPNSQPPVANNDSYSTPENMTLTVPAPGVQANDTSPSGRPLTSTVVTGPSHGTVTLNPNGSFSYTPVNGFTGTDTFTYQDNDGVNNSNVATVTLQVSAVSQPPVANNDAYATNENTPLNVPAPGVQANDTSPSGRPLTSTVVMNPAHGTVTLNPNGSFNYTPATNFSGQDTFTYQDNDGVSNSNVATVTITVNQTAQPPIARDDAYGVTQDTPLTVPAPGVLANDTDPQGQPLTSQVVMTPAHGTVTLNPNGSFTYTPATGYTGPDSFTYQDQDTSGLQSNVATVRLTVNAASAPPPVANNDAYSTTENLTLTVPAPGVQSNDTSPSGRPLTSTLVSNPGHGTVTLNPNGSLSYTPNTNFTGQDSFTYQDSDGVSTSNVATVTITVNPPAAQPPVARDDAYSVTQNVTLIVPAPGVQANDTDPQGQRLISQLATGPTHGSVTLNTDGSFNYTPNTGYTGPDSFTYTDHDTSGLTSNTATVRLTINAASSQPPVANNDTYAAIENTPLTVPAPGVQANDTSPSGQPLTSTIVMTPAHGTVTLNPDGSFTYTPATNFTGPDTFTYQDNDGVNTSNVATVTINVNQTAQPPVARDDAYSAAENTPLNVPAPGVQGNDTDPQGQPLTSQLASQPTHGTVTLNPDGSFTYTPTNGYTGPDSFTYTDRDTSGLTSNTATVRLTVNLQTAPPVARNDSYGLPENSSLTVPAPGVQSNDSSPSGLPLTSTVVTGPTHGTVTLNPNGSFTYTPAANFSGQDTFTYQDNDSINNSNVATVTLNVSPVSPAPVANNDAYTLPENAPLTVPAPGVLGNDVSNNGQPLTAMLVQNPMDGTVTLNPDGSFTYTPNTGFTGQDTFTYQDSNGQATSNVATVTLTVVPGNQPPTARDDFYSTPTNTALTVPAPGVLTNDTDPQGQPLTPQLVGSPTHGTLTLNPDGSLNYVPANGYTGPDSFTYQDRDTSGLLSNVATVHLTVGPASSQPPVANNDAYSLPENSSLTVPAPGVQSNDSSPSGLPLTSTVVTGPAHGTVTLNADGSFHYTPTANFSGQDTFTYQDNDGVNSSNIATVTLTVNPVSPAPVANNDAYSLPENGSITVPAPGVQANDLSNNGQPLTSTLVTQPAHGTLTFNPNGSFTYTPNPGFTGTDTYTYQDNNGVANSNVATVTLNVAPVTQPPVARNDAYATPANTPLTVPAPGVQGNDTDPQGQPLTSILIQGPTHGTVTLNPDGSLNYVPANGYTGPDSFTYQDRDTSGLLSNVATVAITVGQPNQPPVANNDAYSTNENTPLNVPAPGVQSNDTSPSGRPLTSTVVTPPTHGTVTLSPNGTLSYTPNGNFTGTDTFTYQDNDGVSNSNVATVTVTVNAVNQPPVANNDAYSLAENATLTVPKPGVQGNDFDPQNQPLTSTIVSLPTHGTVTLNPDGSFSYTPNANFSGADSFTYRDQDTSGLQSNVATVALNVGKVVQPPVAVNDSYSTSEETTLTVPGPGVQSNDSDPQGLPLTSRLIQPPADGTVTFNANGSFVYTPKPGFHGPDTFTYQDSNGTADSNVATVTIHVGNQGPVVNPDNPSTPENTPVVVHVTANDTDQDHDLNPGSVTIVSTPANGTVTVGPGPGNVTYTPAQGFTGTDTFVYQVSDTEGVSGTATVTVTVNPSGPFAPPTVGVVLSLQNIFPNAQQRIDLTLLGKPQLLGSTLSATEAGLLVPEGVFVQGLYRQLLGHDPDFAGLAYWVELLQAGVTRQQVVDALWMSPEHLGAEVDHLYAVVLNRAADPFGRSGWVSALQSGADLSDMTIDFLTSPEFQATHPDGASFVSAIYTTLLGRQASQADLTYWTQTIQNGASRLAVIESLLGSDEVFRDAVDFYYAVILHRTPDAGAMHFWSKGLAERVMPVIGLGEALLASDEYFAAAVQASLQ